MIGSHEKSSRIVEDVELNKPHASPQSESTQLDQAAIDPRLAHNFDLNPALLKVPRSQYKAPLVGYCLRHLPTPETRRRIITLYYMGKLSLCLRFHFGPQCVHQRGKQDGTKHIRSPSLLFMSLDYAMLHPGWQHQWKVARRNTGFAVLWKDNTSYVPFHLELRFLTVRE